LLEFHYL